MDYNDYELQFCPYKGEKIPKDFKFSKDYEEIVEVLNKSAKQCERELISKFFILRNKKSEFVGYVAISLKSIEKKVLEKGKKTRGLFDRPAIVIGQLIIDENHQGKGYGTTAINFVIAVIKLLKVYLPCRLLVVEAINDEARRFYEKRGFKSFPNDPYTLVLDLLPILKMES